eukprot:5732137-Alexandrium_andersonii.AAC.1
MTQDLAGGLASRDFGGACITLRCQPRGPDFVLLRLPGPRVLHGPGLCVRPPCPRASAPGLCSAS